MTKQLIDVEALRRQVAALKVEPDTKPRGAAREPWYVGYNDALEEVQQLLRQLQRTKGGAS